MTPVINGMSYKEQMNLITFDWRLIYDMINPDNQIISYATYVKFFREHGIQMDSGFFRYHNCFINDVVRTKDSISCMITSPTIVGTTLNIFSEEFVRQYNVNNLEEVKI